MTQVEGVHFFSNSEITTFQGCPRKWWLAWYRGLTPRAKDVQGPRSTGTRIHAALAGFYAVRTHTVLFSPAAYATALLNEEQENDLAVLYEQHEFDEDLGIREAKLKSDFELERIMLEGYLEWVQETGIDADLEVVGVEQYLEVPMHLRTRNAKYDIRLIGKVDSRVRSRITGRRKFIDHKTVQTVNDPTLNMNRQMLHYHLQEELSTPAGDPRCDGALYNMLRKVKRTAKAKPPFYARVPIDHNKFQIHSYKWQMEGLIRDILERTEYLNDLHSDIRPAHHQEVAPARPSRECSWCPFMKVCTMFDDGSRVEAALEDLYEVKDPLSYYGAREKESDLD